MNLLCDCLINEPVTKALTRNRCFLRSYQSDALHAIYEAALAGKGGRFAVMFPRQSGKNETQAQLEASLMEANLYRGGTIIKITPTEKNQGKISTERLAAILRTRSQIPLAGSDSVHKGNQPPFGDLTPKFRKDEVIYGSSCLRCLSASPNAAIVGATADLLLEVDEAQLVSAEKFDREAAPMAASTNAVQVFWGTAWDDRTLLAREIRRAEREETADSPIPGNQSPCRDLTPSKHVFMTTAAEVAKEVPEYGAFVRDQVQQMGREHPAIRTQFFCEEITELTSRFTAERIERMKGEHELSLPQEKTAVTCF